MSETESTPILIEPPQGGTVCAPPAWGLRVLVIGCVYLTMMLNSAWRSPVPAINEPHWMAKAHNYWRPAWCEDDIFLQSKNAHQFYFQAIGLVSLVFSFETATWIGRFVAYLLMAIGFSELLWRLIPSRWGPLWACWCFSLLTCLPSLSGEWVIGGVEAKVFAYALLFWSLAFLFDRKWIPAAICGGFTLSFHPVVGMWSVLCLGYALGWHLVIHRREWIKQRPHLEQKHAIIFGVFLLCAAPGMVPAVSMLGSDASESDAREAAYIQVYYRLAHHLDPMSLPKRNYATYAGFLLAWVMMRHHAAASRLEPLWATFITGALLVAVVGYLVGLGPRPAEQMPFLYERARLLRFYPFRLWDGLMPMAVAISATGLATQFVRTRIAPELRQKSLTAAWGLFACMGVIAIVLPDERQNPSLLEPDQLAHWHDVCDWISYNTPEDALFLTPVRSFAFKWYAQRAEFATFKDCPQDAEGLILWNNRLIALREWFIRSRPGGISEAEVDQLHTRHGIRYVLASRGELTFDADVLYENDFFRLYDLGPIPE